MVSNQTTMDTTQAIKWQVTRLLCMASTHQIPTWPNPWTTHMVKPIAATPLTIKPPNPWTTHMVKPIAATTLTPPWPKPIIVSPWDNSMATLRTKNWWLTATATAMASMQDNMQLMAWFIMERLRRWRRRKLIARRRRRAWLRRSTRMATGAAAMAAAAATVTATRNSFYCRQVLFSWKQLSVSF